MKKDQVKPASVRRKAANTVRVTIPVFFDVGEDPPKKYLLSRSLVINGAGLYGDLSKREGLRYALDWADKHKKHTRIIEVSIKLTRKAQGHSRMSEEMLMSGEYGMLRLERYASRQDLYDKIADRIEVEAKKRYPTAKPRTAGKWLLFDSGLCKTVMDMFPELELVVVDGATLYTPKGASVSIVYIRDPVIIDSAIMLYEEGVRVILT